MKPETLINIDQAAHLLGLKKQTIKNKISQKTFPVPYVKIFGEIRFKPSEIQKYIESKTVQPIK